MEGNIKKLKDANGQFIYPITRGEAVYVEDNKTLKQKLNELGSGGGSYTLPMASSSVLGGIKIGSGLSINNGVLSVSSSTGSGGLVYKGLLSDYSTLDNNAYLRTTLEDGIYVVLGSNKPPVMNPPLLSSEDFIIEHRRMFNVVSNSNWAFQTAYSFSRPHTRYVRRVLCGSAYNDGRQQAWQYIGGDMQVTNASRKKLLTIGDSISAKWAGDPVDAINYPQSMIPFKPLVNNNTNNGLGTAGYQIEFITRLNLDVWTLARGGTKMARTPSFQHYDPYSFAMITRPPNATLKGDTGGIDLSGFDYITIKYGTNDAGWSLPVGTIDSEDTETYMGAMNVGIQQIYAQNPRIQIFFITPPPRFDQFTSTTDLQERWRLNQEFNKPYTDACLAVCEKWNIPCFDSSKNSGVNYYNHSAYMNVDKIHYEDYSVWGGRISEWLRNYL